MNEQQEIGGAQALLQLGSKGKSDDEQDSKQAEEEAVINSPNNEENGESEIVSAVEEQADTSEGDLSKATNEQINDAVEAAVMRYVGGTLEGTEATNTGQQRKNKRKLNHEDIMSNINEFNHWTGFLDDEMTSEQQDDFHSFTNSHADGGASQIVNNRGTTKRKRKKDGSLSHGHNEIDPELTGLDTNVEHDQLVQAAILDARELAKHLGHGAPQDNDSFSATNLQGLTQQQAQQVIAAATAAAHSGTGNAADSIPAINQLAQAASSLNNDSSNKSKQKPRRTKLNEMIYDHNKQEDSSADSHLPQDSKRSKMNYLASLEALIEDASIQACNWYNSIPHSGNNGPRIFSPEEISAVDHFIAGYCHLNKLSRNDICNRIWSNERKKDNFWESLTRILPYRSRASVYKHVRRQYHVFEVRAKWNKEDDELLRKLASTKGGNWKDIGEAMGRMPEDCRDRWRNYVKCGENRVLNKWSESEEAKLREIVSDMMASAPHDGKFKGPIINWTVVSEKMNGVRSRIQCRYKWNKLVKRASAERASYMSQDNKLWLLRKIQSLGFPTVDSIDWNYIVHLYDEESKNLSDNENKSSHHDNWGASDFKIGFEKMKSEIKDHRKLPLPDILQRLINDICIRHGRSPPTSDIHNEHQSQSHHQQANMIPLTSASGPMQFQSDRQSHLTEMQNGVHDEDEATSIANAAVAAVSAGVHGDDAQPQEYSLWR